MKLSKWFVSASAILISAAVAAVSLTACKKDDQPVSDPQYLQKVSEYTYFKNTTDSAIPEYNTYHHVHDFLDACQIENGNAVSPEGKIRKVLFVGFDGMRIDALPYVLDGSGNAKTGVSGIGELTKTGGLYVAYCGGETGTDTEQTTSTSASWTSHFTGVWGSNTASKRMMMRKIWSINRICLNLRKKGWIRHLRLIGISSLM